MSSLEELMLMIIAYSTAVSEGGFLAATTIPVEKERKDRLRFLGKKGETYDEIPNRLMFLVEKL
jgi:hypothetical protein